MDMPKLPAETKPFLWGALSGAVALAIVGFNWGGWVTGGTAEELAKARTDEAIVAALTPICVAQFRKDPAARESLAKLKGVNTWEQGDYVSRAGWATMPGSSDEPNPDVASACANVLAEIVLKP